MKAVLEALHRPEYTGERRCWPCTGLNAVLLAVGVAVVWLASATAALLVGVVGAAAIWLRGYLVPYTPQFAPRLVAALPGVEGHDDRLAEPTTLVADGELDGEAVLTALLEAGVVEAGPDGETLDLDESFRECWRAEMRPLRELDDEELAGAVLEAAPGAATAEPPQRGRPQVDHPERRDRQRRGRVLADATGGRRGGRSRARAGRDRPRGRRDPPRRGRAPTPDVPPGVSGL